MSSRNTVIKKLATVGNKSHAITIAVIPPNISANASNTQKVKKLVSESTNQTIIARNIKTKTDSKMALKITRRNTGSGNWLKAIKKKLIILKVQILKRHKMEENANSTKIKLVNQTSIGFYYLYKFSVFGSIDNNIKHLYSFKCSMARQ